MTLTLPLKDLVLSPLNVRKTPPSKSEQAELAASILAHGLLENLIVRATDDGGHEVLAGGRRLMALRSLARDGEIEIDHPVACLVHDGDGQEISLAENIVRLSMHALDQFEAFAALADQGAPVIDIAARFGITETLVRQRLRLGRAAPEIRAAYGADDITLETLMAFAVTEDHGEQLAVWSEIKGGTVHAHHVRHRLTDGKIAAISKFVRFVGLDAYKAAGGTITLDLFSEGDDAIYLDDRGLIMRLAQEKLTAAGNDLQATEGWKWMRARPEVSYEFIQDCQNVYPQNIAPTPAQEAELHRLQDGLEQYEAMDTDDGLSPEDENAVADLEAKLTVLEDSLRAYAPDDLARAGCLVTLDYNGELSVRRGLVLPEDQSVEIAADGTSAKATSPYSGKLLEDLGAFRLEIAQAHLARDFNCAFDVLLFTLAHGVLGQGYLSGKPLDLSIQTTLPHNWAERFGTSGAEQPGDIDLGWLNLPPAEGFAALAALPMDAKQQVFATCTALCLHGGLAGDDLHEAIGQRLGIDVAAHWRPTAETFFKRVTKSRALDIAAEVLGEQWARNHKDEKKAVLAEALDANFNDRRTPGVTPERAAVAARWLPPGMAYAADPELAVRETPGPDTHELPDAFCVPAAE